MKKVMRVVDIKQSFPTIGLLLYAVSPVTESTDWLFVTVTGLAVLLLLLSMFFVAQGAYRKDWAMVNNYISGDIRDKVMNCSVIICGLLVCYSLGLDRQAYIWWVFLACEIIVMLFPSRIGN